MSSDSFKKIYIIAGEASGDLLGSHLMKALAEKSEQPIRFFGVGGEKMAAEGLSSLFPYQELSMLGFLEVLPHAMKIFARVSATVDDIIAKEPDIVITIDVPGFNLRVVERLRKQGCKAKFVHYVAPSVWAYKPQRALKCAKLFDHMLVLLPFEPPYFEKVGLPCSFIGHPIISETKTGDGDAFRKKYEIAPDTPLFTVLPGSRKGEIDRLMPIFARALSLIATHTPNLAIAVTVPKHVMPLIAPYFENCPFRAVIMSGEEDKRNAFAASQLALVKSGTVALEVAKAGVPMIVTYRVNPISAYMLKRIILTKFANLINIILDREAIPELLQEHCNPEEIAAAAIELLNSPERQEKQKSSCTEALNQLKSPDNNGSSSMAAQIILNL
ncbi:MAG: lipid-A-disaccharide synthase [Rickettsiales bacterium]